MKHSNRGLSTTAPFSWYRHLRGGTTWINLRVTTKTEYISNNSSMLLTYITFRSFVKFQRETQLACSDSCMETKNIGKDLRHSEGYWYKFSYCLSESELRQYLLNHMQTIDWLNFFYLVFSNDYACICKYFIFFKFKWLTYLLFCQTIKINVVNIFGQYAITIIWALKGYVIGSQILLCEIVINKCHNYHHNKLTIILQFSCLVCCFSWVTLYSDQDWLVTRSKNFHSEDASINILPIWNITDSFALKSHLMQISALPWTAFSS